MKLKRNQILQIPVLLAKGKTEQQIANKFEVTVFAISYWVRILKEQKIIKKVRMGRPPISFKKNDK